MAQQAEQQFRKLQVMGSNPIIGSIFGVWRSLVARFVRDEEVAGSNPVTPTKKDGIFTYAVFFIPFDISIAVQRKYSCRQISVQINKKYSGGAISFLYVIITHLPGRTMVVS